MMRYLQGLLAVILILFALVQFNDPEVLYWFAIYLIAAIWCVVAAVRPVLLAAGGRMPGTFLLCLAAAAFGTFYYWPSGTAWWTKEVIWDNELVREGLGMAIVFIALLLVAFSWWRARQRYA
jgi:hypothetical protein